MWLYVCENMFNLVKVYIHCCKICKGLTFFLDTVYIKDLSHYHRVSGC